MPKVHRDSIIWTSGVNPKAHTFSSERARIHHKYTNIHHGQRSTRKTATRRSQTNMKQNLKRKNARIHRYIFNGKRVFEGSTKRTYFSGTNKKYPPGLPKDSTAYSVLKCFKGNILDTLTVDSGSILLTDGDNEFVAVLPKKHPNGSRMFNKHTSTSIFDELLESKDLGLKDAARSRSSSRLVAQTDGKARAIFLGPKCRRNGTGTMDLTGNMTTKQRKEIIRIMKVGERFMQANVPQDYIKCHIEGLRVNNVPMFTHEYYPSQTKKTMIFPSFALGKNVYLPMHDDRDAFLSLVTICDSQQDPNEQDVLAYFCFPAIGHAFAMRHGDTLIFNPRKKHCVSSKAVSRDIYVMSLYCKTSLVGGNDNSKPLTFEQTQLKSTVNNY